MVPPWLTGTLLRTAPAKFEVGDRSYNHWFDGLAMLHKFAFTGGRVAYANRYLRSRSYLEATATGKISRGEFATDPCRTLFQRVAAWFSPKFTDNCNVSVNKLADEVVAYTETRMPIRFDPVMLNTLGVYNYDERIKGPVSLLTRTSTTREVGTTPTCWNSAGGEVSPLWHRSGDGTRGGRCHALCRPTRVHALVWDERTVSCPGGIPSRGQPASAQVQWQAVHPELPMGTGSRGPVSVVHKETGHVVRTARSRAVFAFHHVNAFEEGDEIVVDIIAFPDSGVIDQLYLEHLRSAEPVMTTGKLTRFRIGSSGDASDERLSEARIEFPRINYCCRAGRRYCYVYGAGNEVQGNFIDNLVKLDLEHNRPHLGTRKAVTPESQYSWRGRTRRMRTTGSYSRLCWMQRRPRPFCSSWTPRASGSWPARRCHTISRLASTEITSPRRAGRSRFETSIDRALAS